MTRPAVDPSGILERVPELLSFCSNASVRKAVERGRPFAVYRALFWARLLNRFPGQKDTLEMLLGRRRLFLEPMRGAPGLFTFNSVGLSAYGQDELDENDGAFVITHFVVAAFVPFFPLGAYLVTHAGEGGWYFHGKVPLGTSTFFWNRAILAGLGLAVLAGVGATVHSEQYGTVHVASGLPMPVHVEIGREHRDLSAGAAPISIELPTGRQAVVVRDRRGGRVIERGNVDVVAGSDEDITVWNVLGSAVVYREEVAYTSSPMFEPPAQPPQVFCGREKIFVPDVDYAFETPPERISMPSHSRVVQKSRLDVVPGTYSDCVQYLTREGQLAEAAALATRVAEATQLAPEPTILAVGVAQLAGRDEEAMALARRARDAHPDLIDAHRLYQSAFTGAGRREEVQREYHARAVADPTSPDAAYLDLRLRPAAETLVQARALVAQHPRHVRLRALLAFGLYCEGRWEEAAETWLPLEEFDEAALAEIAEELARTLARAGRSSDALARLEVTAADPSEDINVRNHAAILYARIARSIPAADPLIARRRLGDATTMSDTWLRIHARMPVSEAEIANVPPEEAGLATLYLDATRNPDAALAGAIEVGPERLRGIEPELWFLLFSEAIRRDPQGRAARVLREGAFMPSRTCDAIERYVTEGTMDPEIEQMPPHQRCGLFLARSRITTLPPEERARLRDRALREDVLGDVATIADAQWPPP